VHPDGIDGEEREYGVGGIVSLVSTPTFCLFPKARQCSLLVRLVCVGLDRVCREYTRCRHSHLDTGSIPFILTSLLLLLPGNVNALCSPSNAN
jgi:hypothetical protein